MTRPVDRRARRAAGRRTSARLAALAGLLVAGLGLAPLTGTAAHAAGQPGQAADEQAGLFLVTLDGSGVAGDRRPLPDPLVRLRLQAEQDRLLAAVGVERTVYRWTTALNGFAARLTTEQVEALRGDPRVTQVEPDARRRLAARSAGDVVAGPVGSGRTTGGAGIVIGLVDTGIAPRNPLFTAVPGLGGVPSRFADACQPGEGWSADTCNPKLVAARWFVDGYGAERVRSSASLSAYDDDGHGTQAASIAAGNAGVTARVQGRALGSYAGLAPQARIAAYKACWSAPDPDDDGCSTADVVTAVDRAVRDGVDVLNLSLAGGGSDDTVSRALLGATEADIVVVAAAGNAADRFTGHPVPWVTTVGGATGVLRRGEVVLGDERLAGVMTSARGVDPAPLVLGADAPARGASRADARVCAPGSLDASRVGGRIVLCERGDIGRVDKSEAVRRADGVGMVLVNVAAGPVDSDLHAVPTVHLGAADGRRLRDWLSAHPRGRVALRPDGLDRGAPRSVGWSSPGDPASAVLKPDLVAPATGLLAALPHAPGWGFTSGTSAAAAFTSGAAALVRSAHRDWSAAEVRSALATTASRVRGPEDLFGTGAGRVRPERALDPGLVYRVRPRDYRDWLEGAGGRELNTPSILMPAGRARATRTVTNVGRRALYFSSRVSGFDRTTVRVTPAAVRLAPGESAEFTVTVVGGRAAGTSDQGFVTWRGARGTVTRIPVVLAR